MLTSSPPRYGRNTSPDATTEGHTTAADTTEEDPFAELDTLSPDELFSAAVREALAAGAVTDESKARLRELQTKLGLSADKVKAILAAETKRGGGRRPDRRKASSPKPPGPKSAGSKAPEPRSTRAADGPARPTMAVRPPAARGASGGLSGGKTIGLVVGVLAVLAAGVVVLLLATGVLGGGHTPTAICKKLSADGVVQNCGRMHGGDADKAEVVGFEIWRAGDLRTKGYVGAFDSKTEADAFVDRFQNATRAENAKARDRGSSTRASARVYASPSGKTVAFLVCFDDDVDPPGSGLRPVKAAVEAAE